MSARLVTIADMLAEEIGDHVHAREHELLARCLRLEARIRVLERERADAWPPRPAYRKRRQVTPDDITRMQALRRQGMNPWDIASMLLWSYPTVRRYTHDVLVERAVGE